MGDIVRKTAKRVLTVSILIFIIFFAAARKVEADDHSHDGYKEWNSPASLPNEAGNWLLTNDVSISETWTVPHGEVSICLNGHNISTTSNITIINIQAGTTLNIYAEKGETISHNYPESTAIAVRSGATLNLFGGTIAGSGYGIHLDGGTAVLGDEISGPEISGNAVGIYSSGSDSSLTINHADITNNEIGIKLSGTGNTEISEATIISDSKADSKAVVIDNSDVSFRIFKGTVKGSQYSFTSESNAHPEIILGDDETANDLFISGAISFNIEDTDHLSIYEGYYDTAAYESVKDSHSLARKKYFTDSDIEGYAKKVAVKSEGKSVYIYNKDMQGNDTNDGEVIADRKLAYVNDLVTLTIKKRSGFDIRELKILDWHKNPVPYKRINYNTFTFYMPDTPVNVYGYFDRNYRIDFDVLNADVEGSPGYAFEGDEITFSLRPTEGHEMVYVYSDDVEVKNDYADNFSFKMPAKVVTVKGAYLKKTHVHDDGKSFFLWNRSDALPAKAGSYALATDVSIHKDPWFMHGDFDLCLNGHKITTDRGFAVYDKFNLYDCDPEEKGEIKSDGYIDFGIVGNEGRSVFNMYGGTISNFNNVITSRGTVNIQKGKLVANDRGNAIDLSRNARLTVGNENDSDAPIFIRGSFQFYETDNKKLNSGYYDSDFFNKLYYITDKDKLFPTGKGLVPSGRTDEYTYKIGSNTPFNITIADNIQHGRVSCEKTAALPEEKVSVDVYPDIGYVLKQITVRNSSGRLIDVDDNNQFTMPASHVTVNAVFEERSYSISYDLDGGQMPGAVISYTISSEPITLPQPTKEHYTFLGWTGTGLSSPQLEVTIPTGSTENRTYKANWEKIRHWISFVDDDRTVLQKTQVGDGDMPEYSGITPTKAATAEYSYTFNGWDKEIAAATKEEIYTAAYISSRNKYTITWVDGNGTVLKAEDYEYGSTPVYSGATPTKEENDEFTYTFNNTWYPTVSAVTKNAVYTAQFDSNRKQYTIVFEDKNGKQLSSKEYDYGTAASAIKVPDVAQEYTEGETVYTFAGWNPSISQVVKDATYTATYVSKTKTYKAFWRYNVNDELIKGPVEGTIDTINKSFPADPEPSETMKSDAHYEFIFLNWQLDTSESADDILTYYAIFSTPVKKHQIRWYNGDVLLETDQVNFGATPIYYGDTPSKASDDQYIYTFSGWDPSISSVSRPMDYFAKFDNTLRKYRIVFKDAEGNVLKTDELDYGTKASQIVKPADPNKEPSVDKTYTFIGWKKEGSEIIGLEDVKGDAAYKPEFKEEPRLYQIIWKNDDGTVLETDNYQYDATPEYNGSTPVKTADAQYEYTFKGWTPEISSVTADATYTAEYDAVTRKYTVRFISSIYDPIDDQTVEYGNKATKPEVTPKEGYSFGGYFKDAQFTEIWDFAVDKVTGDTDIYLKAVGDNYVITLDANGGDLPDGKNAVQVEYRSKYAHLLPTPEKEGVVFDGWYTDRTFSKKVMPDDTYDLQDNTLLVARYKYKVFFREVDGKMNPVYVYEDQNRVADPGKAADKGDYVFDYWATSSGEWKFDFLYDETVPNMVLAGKYHRYAYNGNEQTWILNDKGKLGFRFVRYERVFMDKLSDLDLKALFEENDKQLFINDVLLDPAYYDYREGSLIIDLKDSYLNSLSVGRYNLTVKFADGEVSAAFNVKERVKPSTDSYVMPKTGS